MKNNLLWGVGLTAVGISLWWFDRSSKRSPKKVVQLEPEGETQESEEPFYPVFPQAFFGVPKPPEGVGGLGATLPVEKSRKEPTGGWEHRWNQRRTQAVFECRQDPKVVDYPSARACVLKKVFPEAAPWTLSSKNWPQWMLLARSEIGTWLINQAKDSVGTWNSTQWPFIVWLFYDRTFPGCVEELGIENPQAIAHCIISEMYPDQTWPPLASDFEWKKEVWDYVLVHTQQRLIAPDFGVGSFSS